VNGLKNKALVHPIHVARDNVGGEAWGGRFTGHPFLPFTGVPNRAYDAWLRYPYATELVNLRYRTNSYGFRTREFTPKQPGTFRVLCFGGSTTFGVGPEGTTWPEVLEEELKRRFPGRAFEVFNLGQDTASSAFSVVNLALVGVHLEPDLVIVYQCANDLAALGYKGARTDYAHRLKDFSYPPSVGMHLPRWVFHSRLVTVVCHAIDTRLGAYDLFSNSLIPAEKSENPYEGEQAFLSNLRTLVEISRGYGAKAILSTFHSYDDVEAYRYFNPKIRAIARELGVPLCDQAGLIPHHDKAYHIDDIHFTVVGRQAMAKNYADLIEAEGLVERK